MLNVIDMVVQTGQFYIVVYGPHKPDFSNGRGRGKRGGEEEGMERGWKGMKEG